MHLMRFGSILALIAVLTACGGGGGGALCAMVSG
jgi:hypothetical protein